jgi:LPPG:FO 2-phospho-L-lactate transferase
MAPGVVLALAGGVGGARLARGLAQVLAPDELAIAVNVGDDFEHLGLAISPDLDTVMYTLAGVVNPETGWGRAAESWNFMQALAELGGETWFRLGDKDLAVHVERTRRLRAGESLASVTADLCGRFGVRHPVLPATEAPLRTRVQTDAGELAFQDYFVRQQCRPVVRGLRFDGAEGAEPSPPLAQLLASQRIRGVVLCPSNPWLSVAPVLAVSPLRELLASGRVPVVAVSPIVGGAAVKGPAAKIMGELGLPVSALGVVRHYGALVRGWVLDRADAAPGAEAAAGGAAVAIEDTLMTSLDKAANVARAALALLQRLEQAR